MEEIVQAVEAEHQKPSGELEAQITGLVEPITESTGMFRNQLPMMYTFEIALATEEEEEREPSVDAKDVQIADNFKICGVSSTLLSQGNQAVEIEETFKELNFSACKLFGEMPELSRLETTSISRLVVVGCRKFKDVGGDFGELWYEGKQPVEIKDSMAANGTQYKDRLKSRCSVKVQEDFDAALVTMGQKERADEYQEPLALLFPNPGIYAKQPLIFNGLKGYFGMVVPKILFKDDALAKLPESSNQLMNLAITLQEEMCFGLRSSTAICVGFESILCDVCPLDQSHGNLTIDCDRYSTVCSSNLRLVVKHWLEGCRGATEAPFPRNLRCLTRMHMNGLKIFSDLLNMVWNFINEGSIATLCYIYNPHIVIGYLLLIVIFVLRNCSITYDPRRFMKAEHIKFDGLSLSYLLKCPIPSAFYAYFGGLDDLSAATYDKGNAIQVLLTEAKFHTAPKFGNFMVCSTICKSFLWWVDGKPFHTYVVFLPWRYSIALGTPWFKNVNNIFWSFKILSKGTSVKRQDYVLGGYLLLVLNVFS